MNIFIQSDFLFFLINTFVYGKIIHQLSSMNNSQTNNMSFYRPCYAARTRLTSTGEETSRHEEPQYPSNHNPAIMMFTNTNGKPISRTFFKVGTLMVWVYANQPGDDIHTGAEGNADA